MSASTTRELLLRGDYLLAFDAASRQLEDTPDDLTLQYLCVLSLARAGVTDLAAERLEQFRLVHAVEATDAIPVDFNEDVAALAARIEKDRALNLAGHGRAEAARPSAELYEAVFRRFVRPYAGINAATMWLVAGDQVRAGELAGEVLELLPPSEQWDYWSAVTAAEARLLRQQPSEAGEALCAAADMHPSASDRASTRKQLLLVCDEIGTDPEIIDQLPAPSVFHFCGHLPRPGFDEVGVSDRVAALLTGPDVIAYGAVAAGGDVIVAERVIAVGGELHVVLPFPIHEFERSSIAEHGAEWLDRARAVVQRATSVMSVTGARHGPDAAAYAYCSGIAMGRALVRARFVAGQARQIAIWDGQPADGVAGTGADVDRWRAAGKQTLVVPVTPPGIPAVTPSPATGADDRRPVAGIVFADVKGFGALRDAEISGFVEHVLTRLASCFDREGVLYRNGWGDAVYAVCGDVAVAADVALALVEAMSGIDFISAGLPELALRVGAHAGPVQAMHDPIGNETCYFGEHLTQAARIEPVAPPGAAYVTEAFAALLALQTGAAFTCDYVGRLPAAKEFGTLAMYHLRRRIS